MFRLLCCCNQCGRFGAGVGSGAGVGFGTGVRFGTGVGSGAGVGFGTGVGFGAGFGFGAGVGFRTGVGFESILPGSATLAAATVPVSTVRSTQIVKPCGIADENNNNII